CAIFYVSLADVRGAFFDIPALPVLRRPRWYCLSHYSPPICRGRLLPCCQWLLEPLELLAHCHAHKNGPGGSTGVRRHQHTWCNRLPVYFRVIFFEVQCGQAA